MIFGVWLLSIAPWRCAGPGSMVDYARYVGVDMWDSDGQFSVQSMCEV